MEIPSYESSILSIDSETERKCVCCPQIYQGVHANEEKEWFEDKMNLKNKFWCKNPFRVENRKRFPAVNTVKFWDHLPMAEHGRVP